MIRTSAAALVLGIALVAATSGCGSSSSDPPTPETVDQAIAAFEQAYRAEDADAVVALCHFPFVLDGTVLAEPAQLKALLQSSFEQGGAVSTAELLDEVIAPVEDTVRVTATFHLVDTIHGESRRAVTITCQRYGERWKGTGFTFED